MTTPSVTYKLCCSVPHQVGELSREEFFDWVWEHFTDQGLSGIHEGTLLAEQAYEQGFETEPWIVDQGLAPEHRDWMSEQKESQVEIYFASEPQAKHFKKVLSKDFPDLKTGDVEEVEPKDWDAEWKKNFKGVEVPPNWFIIPPWRSKDEDVVKSSRLKMIVNPGAGFGTGTHPTTQLCLQLLSEMAKTTDFKNILALDFGSGSGILTVATAILGGECLGCEIDELANDNAKENATLNGVLEQVKFQKELPGALPIFNLLIANILKPILLEFGPKLIERLEKGGSVILSGLIEKDLKEILPFYQKLLGPEYSYQVLSLDEWRAIYWKKSGGSGHG